METIINVMESLVKMNGWTVVRFDIQRYEMGYDISGYNGFLDVKEEARTIRIRHNGTFEYM